MHERRRQPERVETADRLVQGRPEAPRGPHFGRCQPMERGPVVEQLVELALEDGRPAVEAAVREQLVDERGRPNLQPCEAPEEFAASLERCIPADDVERLEEDPGALPVGGRVRARSRESAPRAAP